MNILKKIYLISFTLIVIAYAPKNHALEAFVVSDDKKVYIIDLGKGKLIATSKPINGLGNPSAIDFNSKTQMLYIGSQSARGQNTYDPLVVVNLKNHEFNVVQRFLTEPYFDLESDKEKKIPLVNTVFWLLLSPDRKYIHVGDAADSNKPLVTVLDINTGSPIKWINLAINRKYLTSPDGNKVVAMWPAGQSKYQDNGQTKTRTWQAGLAIGNIEKGIWGAKQELKEKLSFQPPWGKLASPFIYFRPQSNTLEVYNRDNGALLSTFNINKLTGLWPTQTHPAIIANSNCVIFSMSDGKGHGYVVVLDIMKQTVVHKIEVGPDPTNVVLAG
jgi:DNA-binding beta-propeller fold protein YncE